MAEQRIGEFEELVLLAVCGLADEAYAVAVQQRIEGRTGRAASMGAVYAALDRMEEKGLLRSRLGAATPVRGGRRKRLYRPTPEGVAVATEMRWTRERMWEGLPIRPSLEGGR